MYTMHFYHIYLPFSPSSFPRAHLTSIPPDFMFCHFVNTSLSPLSVPTIYIVNGHGASTGACAWYQWPHPHGKILPPQQPWTGNGSSQLRGGGASCAPPLTLECYVAWSFASLVQVTIGAVSSRVWQPRHIQKTTFHRLLPIFQFLHSFPFLFCDAPWVSRTGDKNQILHLRLRTWSHLF